MRDIVFRPTVKPSFVKPRKLRQSWNPLDGPCSTNCPMCVMTNKPTADESLPLEFWKQYHKHHWHAQAGSRFGMWWGLDGMKRSWFHDEWWDESDWILKA